jgi:hypothetical protein
MASALQPLQCMDGLWIRKMCENAHKNEMPIPLRHISGCSPANAFLVRPTIS